MKERRETATAIAVEVDTREQCEQDDQPELEPVGQCPYCNQDLAKREVMETFNTQLMFGSRSKPKVIFTFWACQNPHCSLMFWRLPAAINPRGVDSDYDRH